MQKRSETPDIRGWGAEGQDFLFDNVAHVTVKNNTYTGGGWSAIQIIGSSETKSELCDYNVTDNLFSDFNLYRTILIAVNWRG